MRVMLLGEDPATADLDDPAVPRGLTRETIRAGIDKALADMRARGWQARGCLVRPSLDEAKSTLRAALSEGAFDCVVIGGGLRAPASRVELFEALINLLRVEAPATAIAFNTRPEGSADAAARQLPKPAAG